VNDPKLEILVLIRLVHSEQEKEFYMQIIEKAEELKALIHQTKE
jgi:hypothetical protein